MGGLDSKEEKKKGRKGENYVEREKSSVLLFSFLDTSPVSV